MPFRPLELPPPAFSLQLLSELTAAPTTAALRDSLERSARELTLADTVRFYSYAADSHALLRHDADGGQHQLPLGAGVLSLYTRAAELRLPLAEDTEPTVSLALPLTHQAALVGVLGIEHSLMPLHSALLGMLGELIATAGAVYRLVEEREQTHNLLTRLRDVLVLAVESAEPERRGRHLRLMRLATALGEQLDLSRQAMQALWQAIGYLDVGRLGMAGQPAALVEALHPQRGGEIVRASSLMTPVAVLVEGQNERYDEGPRKSVEGWVLLLSVDVDRARSAAGCGPASTWFASFVQERSLRHHHAALEALTALYQSGRLDSLLEP
jgi:hypothetical protein